jgi:hypothetical protein
MRKFYVLAIGLIAIFVAACGSAGTGTEVKISAEKSLPFEIKTAYADMRPDLTEVHFVLGNYDFSMTPKTANSVEKLKSDKEMRITIGLKGEKGDDFNNPVQPGEYADKKLKWIDIYHYENGGQQVVNVNDRKGKVTISEVTDTEIKGTIDVTGDNGKVVKGSFTARKVK